MCVHMYKHNNGPFCTAKMNTLEQRRWTSNASQAKPEEIKATDGTF